MKIKVVVALGAIITLIAMIPFVSLEAKIQWIMYLSIPFVIVGGSAAVAYVQNIIYKLVAGFVFAAILIAMIEALVTSK